MAKRELMTWLVIAGGLYSITVAFGHGHNKQANIVETAIAAGTFNTLATALETAGLVETLQGEGPFTVLAPTDEAFAKLPAGVVEELLKPENRAKLVEILTYHVIAGRVVARDALTAERAETVAAQTVRFSLSDGQLRVNNARVIKNDIAASNGVIHVIDTVLLPEAKPRKVESPVGLIELAIERGAPLYNAGQATACAAIYEVACQALLMTEPGALSEHGRKVLTEALRRVARSNDAHDNAWTLRHAMDAVQAMLRNGQESGRMAAANTETTDDWGRLQMLADFTAPDVAAQWITVNDNVMGGRSIGGPLFTDGRLVFSGSTNTDGGGFSSIRTRAQDWRLNESDGLVIRYRGDGRPYKADLRTDVWYGGRPVNYWAEFETVADGQWREVKIPFSVFEPMVYGQPVRGRVPELNPAVIQSIGFLIYDKQDGPFELEVDSIQAYAAAVN